MVKLSKDITLAECRQFKAEHPDMRRDELSHHHNAIYKAMKAFNVLDELYPKRVLYSDTLTEEDCRRYHADHPDLNRTEVRVHDTGYYFAMEKLGLLDELYPIERGFKILSIEECERFKQEHPGMNRHDLCAKHLQYHKSMKHHGILDRLYPSRMSNPKYTDQDLIDIARGYDNVKALTAAHPGLACNIRKRGLADVAFAHMTRLGDDKHKLIYAFEFADHSVYVGLTYNLAFRQHRHLHGTNRYSAVREHIENTGLQPTLKQLTELLDVEEAARMEGEWVEKYRSEGWTILNKAKTGSVGTVHRTKDPDEAEVMRLASELVAPKEIARRQGVAVCKVWALLKSKGIDLWKLNEVPVEITDRQGNIVLTFPSLTAACEHYGKAPCSLKVLNHRLERLNTGHTARYNEEKYIIRYGRKYGDKK